MQLLFVIYMLVCSKTGLGIYWYDWLILVAGISLHAAYEYTKLASKKKEDAESIALLSAMAGLNLENSGDMSDEGENTEDDRWSSIT